MDRSVLLNQQKTLNDEIKSIKDKLVSTNKDKESWFNKKEALKTELSLLISKLKSIKSVKDKENSQVSALKKERDLHNKEVQKIAAELKSSGVIKIPSSLKFDAIKLKKYIEKLELSIETEGYTYDKEKEITEKIKKLKKSYNEVKGAVEYSDKMHGLSSKLREERDKANQIHFKMHGITKDSKNYAEFIELSKKINDVRKQQEEAFKKFIEFKKLANPLSAEIRAKLSKIDEIRASLGEAAREKFKVKKENEARLLKDKAKSVEEKLKSKKKLTTEDLIAFQGSN
ncbi:MAG TPA: hypothetical protein VJB94_02510 [Candidatus Nanoarchaeia archaeon]|nr:hypothetical protein [Candidatus Nanoarchaeia archaeon]